MAWQVAACALLIASAHASCNGNECSAGEDGNALLQTKTSLSMEKSLLEENNLQETAMLQTEETRTQEDKEERGEDEKEESAKEGADEDDGEDEKEESVKEGDDEDEDGMERVEPISEIQDGNSGPATGSTKAAYLAAHNTYRCMHGAPAVYWDSNIAKGAYNWIRANGFQHAHGTGLGENLYWSSPAPSDGRKVVRSWYDEVGSCYWPGCQSGSGTVGHFTALVWKDVYAIGCAQSGKTAICRYKTRSCGPNCRGRYSSNVKRASKSYSACKSSGGGGGNLKNCAANSKKFCFGYKDDGSWCWLTHDGKSNFVKDGDNGHRCSSYDGYPSSTYCKGAKSR